MKWENNFSIIIIYIKISSLTYGFNNDFHDKNSSNGIPIEF